MSYQVKLIVKGSKCAHPVRRFTVSTDNQVVVGRTCWGQNYNNAYFESVTLSKNHGLLGADSGGLYYKDTSSKHGSSINGILCVPGVKYYLFDEDRLRLIEHAENPLLLLVKLVEESKESLFASDDKYIGKDEEEAEKAAECESDVKESNINDNEEVLVDDDKSNSKSDKSNVHDPECEIVFYDPSHESRQEYDAEEDEGDYKDELSGESDLSSDVEGSDSDTSVLNEQICKDEEPLKESHYQTAREKEKKRVLESWGFSAEKLSQRPVLDDSEDMDVEDVLTNLTEYLRQTGNEVGEAYREMWLKSQGKTVEEEKEKKEGEQSQEEEQQPVVSIKRKRDLESEESSNKRIKKSPRTTSFARDSLIFLAGGIAMFAGLVGASTVL